MGRARHAVLSHLAVLGLLGAGCGRGGAQCPDASYLETLYWSGRGAPCSPLGLSCPVSYREVCLKVSGTAECIDYGNGLGWTFHMKGDNECCPKTEPDAGAPCQQPPDAGAHLCNYPNGDGGTLPNGYLCASGAWCRSASCP